MKKLFTILFCILAVYASAEVKMALLQPRVAEGSDACRPIELNMVRGELRKAFGWQSDFQVLTRTDVDQMLKELGFQQSGMVNDSQRKKVGEMTGAQYICVSTITKDGTQLYIESYLVDVETGQMTNPATQFANVQNNDYSTLQEPCNALAREMLGDLSGGKQRTSGVIPNKPEESYISTPALSSGNLTIRYAFDSWPRFADIEYRIISETDGVENSGWKYFGTTYQDGTTSFVIRGLNHSNVDKVFIEFKFEKSGYLPKYFKYDVSDLLKDNDVSYTAILTPKQ